MDIVARVNKIVRSQKKEYIKEVNRLVPNNNLPKNLYTKSFADMMSIIMDSGPARPHDNLRIHMTTSIDTIGKAVCTVNGTRMGRAGDFSGPGKLSNAKLLKSYGSTRGIIGLPISDTEFFQACERIFEPALKVVH
ncbi:MAG: hypothetical protein FWE17_00975, partial [Alphaproteobacteria bacterium]|nr:hypothetical protein [Alphaproteobacteria bacterium]